MFSTRTGQNNNIKNNNDTITTTRQRQRTEQDNINTTCDLSVLCCSVLTGLEETDRASVIQTSVALVVSIAPPPTNMDQTVTKVSLACGRQVGRMSSQ